jgi:glutamate racemase
MKIGVFDSGLGGLVITQSLMKSLPSYDYVYLGDTARVPYGNRSQETIYDFTKSAVEYLFKHDCKLVIIACNTASAEALRRIQKEYIPQFYPDRRVLGVLIPTAEEAATRTNNKNVGVIATRGTVDSKAYIREICKIDNDIKVFQQATPLLVPLIENSALQYSPVILHDYLGSLINSDIDTLILGCTHYPLLKKQIRQEVGDDIVIISQDELIAAKLSDYLLRHTDIQELLSKNGTSRFLLTDIPSVTSEVVEHIFGQSLKLEKIELV